jgi:hypothetical protein
MQTQIHTFVILVQLKFKYIQLIYCTFMGYVIFHIFPKLTNVIFF